MIADPSGINQQFLDQDIQDRLDANRNDVRYEPLLIAPSIVNTASTGNTPQTIFADYYSKYEWWEADIVIQGQSSTGAAWTVLTPTSSDYITGHWMFENSVFTSGTAPGQIPPLFATGKTYDINAAAADLLEYWAAVLASSYDVTVDGQSMRRSQMMQAKLTMAQYYRRLARPRNTKMQRNDLHLDSRHMRLLDSDDVVKAG